MKKQRGGFTFVEILAALVFLAILIPAVVEGLTLSSRAAEIAERRALAVELAQNKLDELVLNNAWAAGGTRGDFGQDQPGMRWQATQSTWDMDAMTVLTVEVFFPAKGQERSVSLSTLVSTAAILTSASQTKQ